MRATQTRMQIAYCQPMWMPRIAIITLACADCMLIPAAYAATAAQ